jgi:hypothetical protein
LTAILMLTSSVVLLVSSASYMVWDHSRFRTDVARELSTQAQMVLDNTTAAMSFGDPDAARETLATLSPNRQILAACLYDAAGAFFAEFRRSPELAPCPPAAPSVGYAFTSNGIELTSNKTIGGNPGGSVYFRGDLQEVTARLKAQTVTMSLVLVVALAVALMLSPRSACVRTGGRSRGHCSSRSEHGGLRRARRPTTSWACWWIIQCDAQRDSTSGDARAGKPTV